MSIVTTEDGFDYWNVPGKEELAIMKNVRWGIIDPDHYPDEATVGMTVETIGGCADLRLTPEQSLKLVKGTHISDVKELSGNPCVVIRENGYIRFIRRYR
jgi:hypothetical protein